MNLARRKPLATLWLSITLLSAPIVQGQDSPLLRRVDDHYNHLHTLRARYTEHYTGMGLDRTESGILTLKKPGRMRWAYDAPAGKLFILDGHDAWFYTPGDAQVSRTSAKQLDDLRSPLRFLLGHTQLAKELDDLKTSATSSGNTAITGVPKGMSNRVHLLTLIVSPIGAIQRVKLEETDGANTEFTFTDMAEEVPIPATEFTFHPPPGIAIVDALPPI